MSQAKKPPIEANKVKAENGTRPGPVTEIPVPPPRRGLIWADLDQERIEEFNASSNDENVQISLLSSWLKVEQYGDDPRKAIMVDFFLYTLSFCRERSMTAEQTSALFSILKNTFEQAFGLVIPPAAAVTPGGGEEEKKEEGGEESHKQLEQQHHCHIMSLEKAYESFRAQILGHAIDNPPEQIQLFNPDEIQTITDYMAKTFFRHYKAYQYVFGQDQDKVLVHQILVTEIPMPFLPLRMAQKESAE